MNHFYIHYNIHLTFLFPFSLATFDAKDDVHFYDFPSLSEFTMCFWIQLDAKDIQIGNPIALHYAQKKTQVMAILYAEQGEIKFIFQASPNTEQGNEHQR